MLLIDQSKFKDKRMATSLKVLSPTSAELYGEFVINDLPQLLAEGEQFIAANPGQMLTIDLAKWLHARSMILSLLLAWFRCAKKHKVKLVYLNPPEALLGLAQVSSLDKLLFADALSAA
jgi:ABC-type transporter Mla MlaB component